MSETKANLMRKITCKIRKAPTGVNCESAY